MPSTTTILLAASLLASALSAAPDGWTRIRSARGIETFRKPDPDGRTAWIRGVATDSIRMEVVGKILLDVANYPRWMDGLKVSKVVESSSPDDFVLYNRYGAPWPLRDRDVYVRVRVTRDLAAGVVTARISKIESPRWPPVEGLIRMPVMEGTMRMEAVSRGLTRGEFTQRLDLGGSIPDWGKDALSRSMPDFVFKYVRKASRDSFYIRAADTSQARRALDESVRAGRIRP